jgi:hypothetical protein
MNLQVAYPIIQLLLRDLTVRIHAVGVRYSITGALFSASLHARPQLQNDFGFVGFGVRCTACDEHLAMPNLAAMVRFLVSREGCGRRFTVGFKTSTLLLADVHHQLLQQVKVPFCNNDYPLG